jgi:hypothetical protein
MPQISDLLLAACMFLGAALYMSVGHAGASAYIALMALFGVAPAVMRPTALALNILVASFTSFRYLRAGMFRWRILWPFLLGAMVRRLNRNSAGNLGERLCRWHVGFQSRAQPAHNTVATYRQYSAGNVNEPMRR